MNQDNAYAAFMLDYAAGALTPAERLAARLHRTLSVRGEVQARLAESIGGALLEASPSAPVSAPELDKVSSDVLQSGAGTPSEWSQRGPTAVDRDFDTLMSSDLMSLDWRRDMFGMWVSRVATPMAHLLRLNPGESAPRHGHGRRDVTVVLQGAYSDEFGQYEPGDLVFAEPGLKHTPQAIGNQTCVCFLATEPGKPVLGFLGLFGLVGGLNRRPGHAH